MVKNCRIKVIFAILPFFVFLKNQNSVKACDFLEKITPEEFLEILKTQEPQEFSFDEKQAGGIQIPDSPYAKKQIKKYIEQYTKPFGKRQLSEILDNGELYRLYVRQELKRKNLPAALEYLPVVESEYKPLAVSKSGARGLWQFMDNSIAGLLKKNEYIDERYDPWLSTDAALKKLEKNYRQFRDWPLAIAAYNCGAGAMKKILSKSEKKIFGIFRKKDFCATKAFNMCQNFLQSAFLRQTKKNMECLCQKLHLLKDTQNLTF